MPIPDIMLLLNKKDISRCWDPETIPFIPLLSCRIWQWEKTFSLSGLSFIRRYFAIFQNVFLTHLSSNNMDFPEFHYWIFWEQLTSVRYFVIMQFKALSCIHNFLAKFSGNCGHMKIARQFLSCDFSYPRIPRFVLSN